MKSKVWFLGLIGFFSISTFEVSVFAQDASPSTSTVMAAEGGPGSSSGGSTTTTAALPVSTITVAVDPVPSDLSGDEKKVGWLAGIFDGKKKEPPTFTHSVTYTLSPEMETEMALRRRDWPKPDPVAIEAAAKEPKKWQDPADLASNLILTLGGSLGGFAGAVALGSALALSGPILWAALAAGAIAGGFIGYGLHRAGPHKWIYGDGDFGEKLKENWLKWTAGIVFGGAIGLIGAMAVAGLAFFPFGAAAMGVGALAGFLISNAWQGKNSK